MDFKAPIDITAVLTAVKKHKDILKGVDVLDAFAILKHFTPIPGITDSIELGKVEGGSISSKYTGEFKAGKFMGKIVPRTLKVRPVVMEMSDEPERYRRTYIAEVPGGLRKTHPFELWIIQHGLELASNDLAMAMIIARYSADESDTDINDAFDGIGTVVEEGKAVGDISSIEGNVYVTGELSRANIGEKLLEMWRSRPNSFRNKKNVKMLISAYLGDMYDDWRKDESTVILGMNEDPSETEYLIGTKKRCELVRLPNLPDDSQMVILTTKENICYGFDKESDFKSLLPFASGNPYKFTASGKYVIGFQFVSVHKSEFVVNDQKLDPDGTDAFAYIRVSITPDNAINEGAGWRIQGEEGWRNSGTVVAVKPGEYKIEYRDISGYTTPAVDTKNPTAGNVTEVTGTYTVKG